jgi:hypothetical protein
MCVVGRNSLISEHYLDELQMVYDVSTLPKVAAKSVAWLQATRVKSPFGKSRQVVTQPPPPKTLPLKGQAVTILLALLLKNTI